jgi:hypothetical protein
MDEAVDALDVELAVCADPMFAVRTTKTQAIVFSIRVGVA